MLRALEYPMMSTLIRTKALWLATHTRMYVPDDPYCAYFYRSFRITSSHRSQNCLPYLDIEVKVFVAIYTWLATLCDDAERVGAVADVEMFQQRYMLGEEQPTVRNLPLSL